MAASIYFRFAHFDYHLLMSAGEDFAGRKFRGYRAVAIVRDDAGIVLYAFSYSFRAEFTDEEIRHGFEMAKALGAPPGLRWADVEVSHDPAGRPVLEVRGTVAQVAGEQGVRRWHLSLSHDAGASVAMVVAES